MLAYPPDHWSLDLMASLGKSNGLSELWIGLDGRSIWAEDNMTMSQRQWTSSSGQVIAEIKWKDSQPTEDPIKQCVVLDINSRCVILDNKPGQSKIQFQIPNFKLILTIVLFIGL